MMPLGPSNAGAAMGLIRISGKTVPGFAAVKWLATIEPKEWPSRTVLSSKSRAAMKPEMNVP
ncbi:hypothetical protein D3C73_1566690 [compost metagenome]